MLAEEDKNAEEKSPLDGKFLLAWIYLFTFVVDVYLICLGCF